MTQSATQLVKELTIEYVKQNNMLSCPQSKIDSQVSEIAEVSQIIYHAVEKNFHNFKFL